VHVEVGDGDAVVALRQGAADGGADAAGAAGDQGDAAHR